MITEVDIYIDEDMDKFMEGVLVCGKIISRDDSGNEQNHKELLDGKEYDSAADLIEDIAKRMGVDEDVVDIVS